MRLEKINSPWQFLWYSIRPFRLQFIFLLFLIGLLEIFGGARSLFIQKIIDGATNFSNTGSAFFSVGIWLVLFVAAMLAGILTIRGASLLSNKINIDARLYAGKEIFTHLINHSQSYFSNRLSGSLSSRVDTLSGNVPRFIGQLAWDILSLALNITVGFFVIGSANWSIAFAFLGGVMLLIPLNFFITKKQALYSKLMVQEGAKLRGYIVDVVSNIPAVHQYVRTNNELENVQEKMNSFRRANVQSFRFGQKILFINNILVWIFTTGVIGFAYYFWTQTTISLGAFIMIITIVSGYVRGLSVIGRNIESLTAIYGEIKDGIEEVLQTHEIVNSWNSKELQYKEGKITIDDLSFSYSDADNKIFSHLSLEIRGGQKVGIVGSSGAGKSTFLKLLLREQEANSGTIAIDDQNLHSVRIESLREHIAIVPQEPVLFHRSIKENILYGDPSASEEKMIEVAKKAQAHDFIDALPEKYDSMVGERGVKLSVGQRQRIAIARAFLKEAPILILDEATSALDSESEVAVQKALHNLMEGKTVLAIAHRLSTLREMDRILVFDEGNIVEDGTHTELVEKGGVYASLWKHQAGGFLKEN